MRFHGGVVIPASRPVVRPATNIAMIVRIIDHAAIPAPIPIPGCIALALLAKMPSPNAPKTDQMAINVNVPAQIAPPVRPRLDLDGFYLVVDVYHASPPEKKHSY